MLLARIRNLIPSHLAQVCLLLMAITCARIQGQEPAPSPRPNPAASFDAEAAARAYLQRQTPQEKARSDAYFEGGYWLQLWQFLYAAAVSIFLLQSRLSARMRDIAARLSRFKPVQSFAYAIQYILFMAFVTLPLSIYSDFLREHKYGLATQDFGGWFGDWLKALLVSLIIGSIMLVVLFGIVRRLAKTWHIWGAIATCVFLAILILLSPVFIAPLFNRYTALDKPEVVGPILSLARANGIRTDKVYEVDASRQSKRVSANVSGFFNTMRISLNDNLIQRCSVAEIKAVMGHEMGHYVLNHIYKGVFFFGVVIIVGFILLRKSLDALLGHLGPNWGITGIGDPAIVPLAALVLSCFLFVLTPITNTFIRAQEAEADIFGLNASREPDGFAEAALKLGEYRKMQPSPLEEWIFFDHPSGATRIRTAMRWKAENLARIP